MGFENLSSRTSRSSRLATSGHPVCKQSPALKKKHVDDSLLLEVKSVDTLNAVHQAQVLTYLKLSGIQHGLLINFNTRLLKDGVKRIIL